MRTGFARRPSMAASVADQGEGSGVLAAMIAAKN